MVLGYAAGERFMKLTDPEERFRIQALAAATKQLEDKRDLDRATLIANAVGKLFG